MGIHLALDDFGLGYSSLSYLKRFPIEALKIDQSFVRDLTTDADDASIVSAVIGMGENLRMQVVAEGVETLEQLEFLREHRCPVGQGYYFSRPLVAEDLTGMLVVRQLVRSGNGRTEKGD
jgi:EAL domain-containing protein (putative c-di-GMP-specific phosphodiesterase class I)